MQWDFSQFGIETRRDSGNEKAFCPKCHSSRNNQRDKSLSVDHDTGVFLCHYCGFRGKGRNSHDEFVRRSVPQKRYVKPAYKPIEQQEPTLQEKLHKWFAERGIPACVVDRNKVELRQHHMPQTNKEEWCIAFPYFRDSEVVNVKYRTSNKDFCMETGAELCFYGLDDADPTLPCIFVEGEIDRLSFEAAGYAGNVLSVPNGAGTNLDILAAHESLISSFPKIIWAGDNDESGKRLEAEFIRRVGPERCWRVMWPGGCKDANEVLVKCGMDAIKHAIEQSRPVPIAGAFEIEDLREDVRSLYHNGRPKGEHPGWESLYEFYRPRLGDWTVVTGIPSSGKSAWVAALLVNLAQTCGWQFVVYPPENLPPEEYVTLIAEIYMGKPFDPGPTPRMSEREMDDAVSWAHEHFVILNPDDTGRDLDSLLSLARSYVLRRGVQGFVIDPWNELEHFIPHGMTMTNYIGQSLVKVRNFSKTYRVHTWIVAHPTKLQKTKDGEYPVPTLYDVEDSRHWYNKPDMGIAIHRDKTDDSKPVTVYIQKVRTKWCGRLGSIELYYDKVTGRYSETARSFPVPTYTDNNPEEEYRGKYEDSMEF